MVKPLRTRSAVSVSKPSGQLSRLHNPIHHVSPSQKNGVPSACSKWRAVGGDLQRRRACSEDSCRHTVPHAASAPDRADRDFSHRCRPSGCDKSLAPVERSALVHVEPPAQKPGTRSSPPAGRVTIASTSTWLNGSSYCFPLVYDHSVGSPGGRGSLLCRGIPDK